MTAQRIIGGRYAVGQKIAEGGMGTVYEGSHLLSKKVVALKILNREVGQDETTRSRFLREVAAPAQIGHEGIVEIYDAGYDPAEGVLFVAMELLQGATLRERLSRGGLTQDAVLDLFDELLAALAAAHRAGFVHRDLKPENVFLARRGAREVVKILDFGIARDLGGSDTVTRAGTAMGTPHYMAPEQAMSAHDVGFTADVWAIGVMLYEALTGAPPFVGDTIATLVVEVCTKPHRPLAVAAPRVPAAVAQLVDRCLDKDATRRPKDASELAALLRGSRSQVATVSTPTPATWSHAAASMPTMTATSLPSASMSATPPTNAAPFPTPKLVDARPIPAGPTRASWLVPLIVIALGAFGILGFATIAVGIFVIGARSGGRGPQTDVRTGALEVGDAFYGAGQLSDGYTFSFSAGDHVVIQLDSEEFDTFLVLRSPSGSEVINDDDPISGTLNSRIDTVVQETGTFQVLATSYAPRTVGRYRLTMTSP